MKLSLLLSVAAAQFDYQALEQSDENSFSPEAYGFTDEEIFGRSNSTVASLLADYEKSLRTETDENDDLVAFARSAAASESLPRKLPPGITFIDFVDENGNVDVVGFRQALIAALQAQAAATTTETTTSTTTPTTTTTSTTTSTTTTSITTTTSTTTESPEKDLRNNLSLSQLSMDDLLSALSTNSLSLAELAFRQAQGASGQYNYCRKCTGETAANCIAANRVETCNLAQSICEVTYRIQRNGQVLYDSGCKSTEACQNGETQNFKGSHPWMNQCRSTKFLRSRFFRPIVCRFCHKMGTQTTHLLFQSDENGSNDADAVLTRKNGAYAAQSLTTMQDDPSAFISLGTTAADQLWY